MMYWMIEDQVVPLYIGKAEKYGKKGKNLSQNMTKGNANFCRWGYNYQYHLGDLSAVVCEGHAQEKRTSINSGQTSYLLSRLMNRLVPLYLNILLIFGRRHGLARM